MIIHPFLVLSKTHTYLITLKVFQKKTLFHTFLKTPNSASGERIAILTSNTTERLC